MKTIFGKICSIDAIDPFLIVERTWNDWNRVGLKGGRSERGEGFGRMLGITDEESPRGC